VRVSAADEIRKGREALGWSQVRLAKAVGVSRTHIMQWENPKTTPNLKSHHILSLSRILNRPAAAFERFGGDTVTGGSDRHAVPLLRWEDLRFLGVGGEVSQVSLQQPAYIEVSTEISRKAVALVIQDNSMEPAFCAGEEVIIEPSLKPEDDRDFVLVRLTSGEHLFRSYRRRDGAYDLVANNPEWATVSVSTRLPAEILGTMVEHRRRRRR
jgi:DNA-binding XRE family transcriptional regulator